mmetsp:Transcript_16957/g.51292  ORF Transcript_16957/g.51292 Transcript_16957/m.51292 type:complete len:201 (-) Transcript_16957:563-1165(-)
MEAGSPPQPEQHGEPTLPHVSWLRPPQPPRRHGSAGSMLAVALLVHRSAQGAFHAQGAAVYAQPEAVHAHRAVVCAQWSEARARREALQAWREAVRDQREVARDRREAVRAQQAVVRAPPLWEAGLGWAAGCARNAQQEGQWHASRRPALEPLQRPGDQPSARGLRPHARACATPAAGVPRPVRHAARAQRPPSSPPRTY